MGSVGDFVIDSVVMAENRIKGFAVYPLYGENNFRTIRSVIVGPSLNLFRTEAHDLLLWNPTNQNKEYYKIIIEGIDNDGFPKIQLITNDEVLRIFNQLPVYKPRPGDAV